MTRIFVLCLVLFPVIFVGMLVVTGTLGDVLAEIRQEVEAQLGREKEEVQPSSFDVVDSLIVADLERRETELREANDSLSVFRGRIQTERRELERLGGTVEAVLAELRSVEGALEAQRDKERKSLAKIFGEMDPERAADILAQLPDDDVERIVKSMKERQAAEVLAMLAPGTAARVSRRILEKPDDARREIRP